MTETPTTAVPDRGRPRREPNGAKRLSPYKRLRRFVRQVVAELRKVNWPTQRELLTYTSVVVVFVAIMMGIIALYDLVFSQAVLKIFG